MTSLLLGHSHIPHIALARGMDYLAWGCCTLERNWRGIYKQEEDKTMVGGGTEV